MTAYKPFQDINYWTRWRDGSKHFEVIFDPPFHKCRFKGGTVVGLRTGYMFPPRRSYYGDEYIVRLPSGMRLAVRANRCRKPHPLEALAAAAG